jgi:LuxR family maltose regulon positive regulatory protein
VLEALLQRQMGARNAAHRSLRKALQLQRHGCFVRCLLDEGDGVVELLREAYQTLLRDNDPARAGTPDPDRGHIELLLEASGTDLGRQPVGARPTEALSDREKEMLSFLLDGITNREIATRLFVSENTVKFHLKNIYAKLGVGNRMQAINTARTLKLIH